MSEEQRIPDFTANLAVKALQDQLVLRKEELKALELTMAEEKHLTVKKVMELIQQKAELEQRIHDIQKAIDFIDRAKLQEVKVKTASGGCTG